MRGLGKVIVGAATAALAISALGAPVSAADDTGTLAIVNGYPNQQIDICIGSKEKRSGVPYGTYFNQKVIGTGPKLVRIYKQNDSRTCGGTRIAKKWINISPGWDKTIVVTKKDPKLVVFDNTSPIWLGEIPANGPVWADTSVMAWRSAADFDTNFHFTWWGPNPETPVSPSATDIWQKGDQYVAGFEPGNHLRVRATKPAVTPTAAQRTVLLQESRRYEWILVGTKKGNARFVMVNRGVSTPSP